MEAAAGGDIVVAKGKRSKRQRAHAAAAPEVVTTPAADDSAGAAESSSLSSVVVAEEEEEAASGCVTEEEEDMAMCLMLLARGGHGGSTSAAMAAEGNKKFRSRQREEGSGELVYECRTCSKRFPSFQALGGHRTSHKKPRLPTPKADSEDLKKAPSMSPPPPSPTDPAALLAIPAPATPPPPAAMNPNPKQQRRDSTAMATGGSSRVHECSICGAEFASGQALGGHMRRHRPLVPAAAAASEGEEPTTAVRTKEKSLLELDLNMPPSDDDVHGTTKPAAFVFNVNDLLFPAPTSAPASAMVVDCHY